MGVPAETARSWVRRGLDLVRAALDQQYSGRGAWCLALVPLAAAAPSLGISAGAAAATKATFQTIAMATTQAKIGIAAAALLAIAAGIWMWDRGGAAESPGPNPTKLAAAGIATAPTARAGAAAPTEPVASRSDARAVATESKPNETAAKTKDPFGTVLLHIRWQSDKSPAAGIGVRLFPNRADEGAFSGLLQYTDASGDVRFDRIAAGRAQYRLDRGLGFGIEVPGGGGLAEELVEIRDGYDVDASVVDASGRGVARADIILTDSGATDWIVGKTDAQGKYRVHGLSAEWTFFVGARAENYAPSTRTQVFGKLGMTVPAKLAFSGAGGGVEGRVVDREGQPIANATILIGKRNWGLSPLPNGGYGLGASAARVTSDEKGKFRAVGLQPGPNPVSTRVGRYGPWNGSVDVPSAGLAPLEIALDAGVTLLGSVVDEMRAPVPGAMVRLGDPATIGEYHTKTADDGSFALTDLPTEEFRVRIEKENVGKTSVKGHGHAGESLRLDVVLTPGLKIVGKLIDKSGNPVKGASVHAAPMDNKQGEIDSGDSARSDAQGRFAIANCLDIPHRVFVRYGPDFAANKSLEDVRPAREELVITLEEPPTINCFIRGRVVDSQGKAIAAASVVPYPLNGTSYQIHLADESGAIAIGPIQSGPYAVSVQAQGCAERRLPRHELKSGETWDIGRIEMQPPARLTVRYHFAAGVDKRARGGFDLLDDAGPRAGGGFEPSKKDPKNAFELRNPVPAGSYLLQIIGTFVAASQVEVRLAGDQDNVIDLELAPGIRQSLRIEKPKEETPGFDPRMTIRGASGAVVLVLDWWGPQEGQPFFERIGYFAPGDYRFEVTTSAGATASGTFQVSATPSEPITAAMK
jgi:protocatechuate 3,4-dioxygenase beta subunit